MRPIKLLLCVVGFLGSVATVQASEEADKIASRGLIRQGNSLLDKGDFAQALDKFLEAFKSYPSPKIYFNQGQALHGLKRNVDAMQAYRRFLAEAKDSALELRVEAQKQIADLTEEIGRIEIRCNRNGALLRVDGKELGTTPLEGVIWLEPGNYNLTLDWQGEQKSSTVSAAAGKATLIEADFDPKPGQVRLTTNREGAFVRLDDKDMGRTPLAAPLAVAPGEHKLTVEWQGENKTEGFTVVEGGAASLTVNFADKLPIIVNQPIPPGPEPRRWYHSRWMWVAGGVAAAAVAATLVFVYGSHDKYPSNTMGTQPVGN